MRIIVSKSSHLQNPSVCSVSMLFLLSTLPRDERKMRLSLLLSGTVSLSNKNFHQLLAYNLNYIHQGASSFHFYHGWGRSGTDPSCPQILDISEFRIIWKRVDFLTELTTQTCTGWPSTFRGTLSLPNTWFMFAHSWRATRSRWWVSSPLSPTPWIHPSSIHIEEELMTFSGPSRRADRDPVAISGSVSSECVAPPWHASCSEFVFPCLSWQQLTAFESSATSIVCSTSTFHIRFVLLQLHWSGLMNDRFS